LSMGAFGLQLASTLEMNNTSGLFKLLGANDKTVSLLWLIAPLTGLIIQPVLGQISDLSYTKYGRRIPYVFVGMLLSCLSLFLIPFSSSLAFTAILILILSCSVNAATEALRALVGDITPTSQKATAFSWQSVFSGIAAMLASLVPWALESMHILVKSTTANSIPLILKISFVLGAYILFHSVAAMVREIKELGIKNGTNQLGTRNFFSLIGVIFKELFINILHMPTVIKRFFLIQIFTWAGVFCLWIYFSIALAQHIFNLPANADIMSNLYYHQLMEKSIVEAGICFGIYQASSVLYVMILPKLVKIFPPYKIHASSLLIGAISLILMILVKKMLFVYIFMIGVGMFWGSLATMPYAIISAELPPEKMGTYLGIFNITITIPQIICGLFIGFINQYLFFNHAIFTILLAGILIGIAGVILFRQEGVDLVYAFRNWLIRILKVLPKYR
ncbi:MAG: MFS transporter, partial [Burkholderiales bacterium]